MSRFEPSIETKKAVLENNLKSLYVQIYDLTFSGITANKIGNKPVIEKTQSALEILEKTRAEYESELETLEKS